MVAQVLAEVSVKRSVWNDWNLAAEALRASRPLRMASPDERRALLDTVTGEAARACVHLDDNREPGTRRVGENLDTTTDLLTAEKVLLDAAHNPGPPHLSGHIRMGWLSRLPPHLAGLAPDQAAALQAIVASGRTLDGPVGGSLRSRGGEGNVQQPWWASAGV